MMTRTWLVFVGLVFVAALHLACGIFSPAPSSSPTHPQGLGAGRPVCVTCHDEGSRGPGAKAFGAFDHTSAFLKQHGGVARQEPGVCASCHNQSSCAECHGGKNLLPPSARNGNRPDRESPHRGNFLVQHRFEGKADPSACFVCHGRANNQTCTACHR